MITIVVDITLPRATGTNCISDLLARVAHMIMDRDIRLVVDTWMSRVWFSEIDVKWRKKLLYMPLQLNHIRQVNMMHFVKPGLSKLKLKIANMRNTTLTLQITRTVNHGVISFKKINHPDTLSNRTVPKQVDQ
jgi:hypothetical protein